MHPFCKTCIARAIAPAAVRHWKVTRAYFLFCLLYAWGRPIRLAVGLMHPALPVACRRLQVYTDMSVHSCAMRHHAVLRSNYDVLL